MSELLNALNALPEPEPYQRRIVYRDGTVGLVDVPPVDPPEPYVRLLVENHWYEWDQPLGAYKWYSSEKPAAIILKERERRLSIMGGGLSVLILLAIIIAVNRWGVPFF